MSNRSIIERAGFPGFRWEQGVSWRDCLLLCSRRQARTRLGDDGARSS